MRCLTSIPHVIPGPMLTWNFRRINCERGLNDSSPAGASVLLTPPSAIEHSNHPVNPHPSVQGANPSRVPIDIRQYPGIRRLAGDYAHDFDPLGPFYAGNPARPDDWLAAIGRAQAHPRDRERHR